jgi:two-component system sensor histidine kinase RegB
MIEATRTGHTGAAATHAVKMPVLLTSGRIRLRTLVLIRWFAITGQAAAVLVVHFLLEFELPIGPALAAVAVSAVVNLALIVRRPAGGSLGDRAAAGYLAYDTCQLAVLLYLTGGLGNPFSFLLLAPVTVSATILSLHSTVALCSLALVCISVLAGWHLPLPSGAEQVSIPHIYILGGWAALAIGIVFFTAYTWRVAEDARRLSDALSASQLALAREQERSAVGGLAAAAAHELGSPLGTIAIAASEIARGLEPGSPIRDDVELLISETGRCRDILAGLVRHPRGSGATPFERLPIAMVVEAAAAGHRRAGIEVRFDAAPGSEAAADGTPPADAPVVALGAEIIHGLGNLVQNAVQFAATLVVVRTRWIGHDVTVSVTDDGPGFPHFVLERLGEPYISVREEQGEHMGLGIFIAQTLLQKTGAELEFRNHADGGAEVVIRWPHGVMDTDTGTAVEGEE